MKLPHTLLEHCLSWRSLYAGLLFGQAGLVFAVEATDPAEFNRLFTTPEERALLEDARTVVGHKGHLAGSILERKKIVTYKGVLRANDGSAVLFIDDPRVITNDENVDEARATIENDVVVVKDDAGKNMAMLKPGQSYSLESGKYSDYFEHFNRPASDKTEFPDDPGQTAATGSSEELLAR